MSTTPASGSSFIPGADIVKYESIRKRALNDDHLNLTIPKWRRRLVEAELGSRFGGAT